MSLVVIDPKILIMIDNYTNYNLQVFFRARYTVYESGKLH